MKKTENCGSKQISPEYPCETKPFLRRCTHQVGGWGILGTVPLEN